MKPKLAGYALLGKTPQPLSPCRLCAVTRDSLLDAWKTVYSTEATTANVKSSLATKSLTARGAEKPRRAGRAP